MFETFKDSFLMTFPFLLTFFYCSFLFTWNVRKKDYLWLRFPLCAIGFFALQSLVFVASYQIPRTNEIVSNLGSLIYFASVVILFSIAIFICCKVSIKEAVFFTVASYSLEHFSNGVRTIIVFIITSCGVNIDPTVLKYGFNIGLKIVIISIVFFFALKKYLDKYPLNEIIDNRVFAISIINLCICMVLSIFKGFGFGEPTNSFTNDIICSIYAIFGCFLCLYLQFAYIIEMKLKNDNKMLDLLFKEQNKANQLSKENIDLINIKFHDLKKQLRRLEETPMSEEKEKAIGSIKDTLAIYDAFVKTGNGAIDTILMNTYLTSLNNKIDFTYFIDGEALNMMDSQDVVSLFDNIIANAFDSVLKESKENRVVHLQVYKEKKMAIVHARNYCAKKPKFVKGLPVTNKDPNFHGYGMKSIARIVDKYNGNIKCAFKDETFSINIIIPML